MNKVLWVLAPTIMFLGCASTSQYSSNAQQLDISDLPLSNTEVSIPHLSSCTDAIDKTIHFDAKSPITVLVHGCNGSAGKFRSLAQLYAFHGQQAVCYSYDDRESLNDNANTLSSALNELSKYSENKTISVLGHSMGGLIARKALESNAQPFGVTKNLNLQLVTVSAPFAGIEASSHCGIKPLQWLSLGIVPAICWIITGDNWNEITYSSDFIKYPEPLLPNVKKYLKIVTNEQNACRRQSDDGRCLESDDIFSLHEQYQPTIDSYPNVTGVLVDAGHVEIVGDQNVIPRKLLSILQDNNIIAKTPTSRMADLEKLLVSLY